MNNTPTTKQVIHRIRQLSPKQQDHMIKTMELMQLTGRTDHRFKLIQSKITVYRGNDPQTALNALSNLRWTAIKRLKAGKTDIHAVLICHYPDGRIEIVGEV